MTASVGDSEVTERPLRPLVELTFTLPRRLIGESVDRAWRSPLLGWNTNVNGVRGPVPHECTPLGRMNCGSQINLPVGLWQT